MTETRRLEVATVFLLITLTWTLTAARPVGTVWEKHLRLQVTYTYINEGDEPIPLVTSEYNFKAFEKFVSDDWQKVKIVEKSHGVVRQAKDMDGNVYVILNLPDEIPPHGEVTVCR